MDKITYEPIIDQFPAGFTLEDLRRLYIKLHPLFTEDVRQDKVIQINEE